MGEISDLQKAWTAAAVRALNNANSWTGRIHIHKLLFILQTIKGLDVPFEFELYQYGPYSFALDHTIADMDTYGNIERFYRQPGYGPSYCLPENCDEISDQIPNEIMKKIEATAKLLGDLNSKDLELVATTYWVTEIEAAAEDEEIVDRVLTIKPRYSREEIESRLVKAREIKKSLLGV